MTVRKQKSLLIDRHLPTQEEIRDRMSRQFGRVSPLMQHVISPCAEEAERILYDLLTSSVSPQPVIIKSRKWTGARHLNRKFVSGYICPSCRYQDIRINARYCPGCGKRIEWE